MAILDEIRAQLCSYHFDGSGTTHDCLQCKKAFLPRVVQQKFCTVKCRKDFHREEVMFRRKKDVSRRCCRVCGDEFVPVNRTHVYCSDVCSGAYQKSQRGSGSLQNRRCRFCDKEFKQKNGTHVYCSAVCRNADYEKGYFLIFNRDRFKCFYCGRSSFHDSIELRIDHVLPVKLGGKTIAGNLVTACSECNGMKSATVPHGMDELLEEVTRRNKISGISDGQRVDLGYGRRNEV